MSTSHLSHTAPLIAIPSFPPLFAWARMPLHHVKVFLMHTFRPEGIAFSASRDASHPLPGMPLRFTGKAIYTPSQEWYGYR